MVQALNQLLSQRRRRLRLWFRGASMVVAGMLHLVVALSLIFGPKLLAERREPIEFVAVEIIPALSLPAAKEPVATPQPAAPEPEPPSSPPPPEDLPTLPDPAAEKAAEEEKQVAVPAVEPQAEPRAPTAQDTGGDTRAQSGSPLATGGPTAILGFDNPDFTYGYYVDRMLAVIRAHWVRPPLGGDVKMILHFRIQSNGKVDELEIVQSSGYNSFDLAGRRAVESSSPLPPLPRSFRHPSLGVSLIIR